MDNRYFVTYLPYTDKISRVYYMFGETEKYYKVKSTSNESDIISLISKKSGYLRGSDIRYYELSKEEVLRKIKRQKAINLCEKTKWKNLTDSQLERIKKILEEK